MCLKSPNLMMYVLGICLSLLLNFPLQSGQPLLVNCCPQCLCLSLVSLNFISRVRQYLSAPLEIPLFLGCDLFQLALDLVVLEINQPNSIKMLTSCRMGCSRPS